MAKTKKTSSARTVASSKRPRRVAQKKKGKARKAVTKKKTPPRTKQESKKTIGTCFVMIPFKEPFETYYSSIIRPAVVAVSFEPLRV